MFGKLLDIISFFIPSVNMKASNKQIKKNIETQNLDYPSKTASLEKIDVDELKQIYDKDMEIKGKLEDKAKTNVIGITISVTLIMGSFSLLQNVSDKYGVDLLYWVVFSVFVLSVAYMLSAGLMVIHVLIAENAIFMPQLALEGEEEKKNLDKIIGLNRAQNTIRNNYVYTSYSCIRNSLVCLFIVMIMAILPIHMSAPNTAQSQIHNNFYYSEAAIQSIIDGVDKQYIESFIELQPRRDGNHSVVDTANKLYLKYSESNGAINVILVETYE